MLLAAAGLQRGGLKDSEQRLSSEVVHALWESALTLTKDPLLGLHAAENLPFGEFGLPDFVRIAARRATENERLLAAILEMRN